MTAAVAAPAVPAQAGPVDELPDVEVYAPPTGAAAEAWALVEQARAGDRDAFGALYERYREVVFRFVYGRVNARPLAEDLMQETFLRAFRRIDRVTYLGRDVGAWFVTIARNLVADHFKSGYRRLEVTTGEILDGDTKVGFVAGRHGDEPEVQVEAYLCSREVLAGLLQLTDAQRTCLTLRFFNGLSVAETAREMALNEGACKALQFRAVRALARALPAEFLEAYR